MEKKEKHGLSDTILAGTVFLFGCKFPHVFSRSFSIQTLRKVQRIPLVRTQLRITPFHEVSKRATLWKPNKVQTVT